MSLYFTLWDTGRKVTPVLPAGCPRWANDDEIPMTSLHRFPTGKVEVKMKVVGFDAADGLSRSAAEVFARRQMHALIYYLQTVGYRGCPLDSHVLASVSRAVGVREERRIVGEHVLTEAEARRAAIFPDAVAVNTYHIDFHWPDRMERAGTGITDMLDPHHLPLRMMIPKGARNLLVPGRGASGDQTAMSAYRVMTVAAQMGFAAGHAARQCLERGCDLPAIDVASLQAAIEAGGQSLDLSDYGEYLRCDLCAHEVAASDAGSPTELTIAQLRNGCFRVGWQVRGAAGAATAWRCVERREKTWREVEADGGRASAAPPHAVIALDDGTLVRTAIDDAVLRVDWSADKGATWNRGRELARGCAAEAPALAATRTGLALAYAETSGRVMFWHGSIERLRDGEVVPAAVRLDVPREQVHETEEPRA